jgi:HEAT repeat protein
VRKSAAEALGNYSRFSEEALPPLLYSLKDENVEVRRTAILALAKVGRGSEEVEESLRELLSDPDPITNVRAALAIAQIGRADESSIPFLVSGLDDKDDGHARMASQALTNAARAYPDAVAAALSEALSKNREPLLSNVLKFIRNNKEQHEPLLSSLEVAYDKVPARVRILILATLVEIDNTGKKAVPLLKKALKDRDPALRREALKRVNRYPAEFASFKPAALEALNDKTPENRALAVQVSKGFLRAMPEAAGKFVALSKDPDPEVRIAALSALGLLENGPKTVMGTLEKSAADEDVRIRGAALESLGRLAATQSSAVTPVLERALKTEKDLKNRRIIEYGLQRTGKKLPHDMQYSLETSKPKLLKPGEEIGGYR